MGWKYGVQTVVGALDAKEEFSVGKTKELIIQGPATTAIPHKTSQESKIDGLKK